VWNELAKKYEDKPIIFLGVNSGSPRSTVERYRQSTGFTFPVLVDEHKRTEGAYGIEIGLRNIMQWRIIDASGRIVGWRPDEGTLAKAVKGASFWLYDKREFTSEARDAARALEWGRYADGSAKLARLSRAGSKAAKEDVKFIVDALEAKANGEYERAEALAKEGKKFAAYRVHERVITDFALTKVAKRSKAAMLALKRDSSVRKELMALMNYERAVKMLGSRRPSDRQNGRLLLRQIQMKFKGTEAARLAEQKLEAQARD
jgi:hypothetical protein